MNGNVNKHRLVLVKISLFEFYLKKKEKKIVKNIAKKLSKIVQKSCQKLLDWSIMRLLASCTPTYNPRAVTPNITLQSLLSFSRGKSHLHSDLLSCIFSYLFGT